MEQHADVVILGGGVIGLTTAWLLAEEGVRVRVLDQGDLGRQASWAGAGILPSAPLSPGQGDAEVFRALSIRMFPDLSRRLREQTGVDNGYRMCGGLELLDAEEMDHEEWRTGGDTSRLVEREELHLLEPMLAPSLGRAYHLPDMGQVRNPWHLRALIAACEGRGVQLAPHCAARFLLTQDSRIRAVQTDRGTVTGGHFVLCAGAWTASLLGQVGWRLDIRPIRGQIVLLRTTESYLRHNLLWGKRYLVPREDGRVLVGATEEDVGFDARPTARAAAQLITLATALVPALADAEVEKCWAGLRPGSPDGLPYLGLVPGLENLYLAAGHFRSGILLSPGTGWLLRELILGRPPSLPADRGRTSHPIRLEPFRVDRHAGGAPSEPS